MFWFIVLLLVFCLCVPALGDDLSLTNHCCSSLEGVRCGCSALNKSKTASAARTSRGGECRPAMVYLPLMIALAFLFMVKPLKTAEIFFFSLFQAL